MSAFKKAEAICSPDEGGGENEIVKSGKTKGE
jgi:hypothetical protein